MLGSFNPWKHYDNYSEQMFEDKSSDLQQWPIKLWQVPEVSPYFHHAHLLIAADCSAFACPTFHDKLSKGKVNQLKAVLERAQKGEPVSEDEYKGIL